MDAQHVLRASLLDILFEGRNKEYGAYVLRKEYDKRLMIAMSVTALFIMLLTIIYYSHHEPAMATLRPVIIGDTELSKYEKEEHIMPPPPVQRRTPTPPSVRTIRDMIPVVVVDPPKQDMPPDNDAIEHAKIGTITQEGSPDETIAGPPGSDNGVTGIASAATEDKPGFVPIEIESTFPGGLTAWQRFLNKTLNYPQEAVDNRIEGSVVVQFIVDATGLVSDVQAISGPEELREEAVRVIKKSGTWSPAVQNGRKVKSYKKQPITFRLIE